jgi:hypothetical protein
LLITYGRSFPSTWTGAIGTPQKPDPSALAKPNPGPMLGNSNTPSTNKHTLRKMLFVSPVEFGVVTPCPAHVSAAQLISILMGRSADQEIRNLFGQCQIDPTARGRSFGSATAAAHCQSMMDDYFHTSWNKQTVSIRQLVKDIAAARRAESTPAHASYGHSRAWATRVRISRYVHNLKW